MYAHTHIYIYTYISQHVESDDVMENEMTRMDAIVIFYSAHCISPLGYIFAHSG